MVRPVHENDIRDKLADRLHLIEPGLRLVAMEYALPSRHGASGRIDILARDATNALVVVELKRTEDAAERALHELAKYVELLQQERGLDAADVRVIIAAVEWRGLHTAFSQVAREWTVDLRGYRVVLAEDGCTPVAMQRIEPLSAGSVIALSPNQLLVQPYDGDIDAVWQWAMKHLRAVGANNVVGFEVVHEVYREGLYLVIGRLGGGELQDPESLAAAATLHHVDMSAALSGYEAEYYALFRLCQAPNPFSIEAASPHSLASILADSAWTVRATRRAGVYEAADLYPQEELLAEAAAGGGLSDVKYTGAANVEHSQRWRRCVSRVDFALGGNTAWAAICRAWLDDIESRSSRAQVVMHVYNPCDLVAAIVYGCPATFQQYLPELIGEAKAPDFPVRAIRGGLVWNGARADLVNAFTMVYGTVEHWHAQRLYGEVWESDLLLLDLLGLRYMVFERLDAEAPGFVLSWCDGVLTRLGPKEYKSSGAERFLPFVAWVQAHKSQFAAFAVRTAGE